MSELLHKNHSRLERRIQCLEISRECQEQLEFVADGNKVEDCISKDGEEEKWEDTWKEKKEASHNGRGVQREEM